MKEKDEKKVMQSPVISQSRSGKGKCRSDEVYQKMCTENRPREKRYWP